MHAALTNVQTIDLQLELAMRTAQSGSRDIATAFLAVLCRIAAELDTQQRADLADVMYQIADRLEHDGFVREKFLEDFSPYKLGKGVLADHVDADSIH